MQVLNTLNFMRNCIGVGKLMKKYLLIIRFNFIAIFSFATLMVPGNTTKSMEMNELLDNLRFMFTESNGFNYGHRY